MKFWFGKSDDEEKKQVPEATPAPVAPVAAPPPPPPQPAVKPIWVKPAVGTPPPPAANPERPAAAAAPAAAAPSASAADTLVRPQANQRALYYQMMNALYDAVVLLDDHGHIVDTNTRVESVLGYTREELWDTTASTLIPGLNPQVFAQMISSLHGDCRVLINARVHRKNGTVFPAEVSAGLINLRGENIVLAIRNIEKRMPARAMVRPAAAKAPAS